MKAAVSAVRCDSYEGALVLEAARKATDLIGGISNFIKPQSRVLVKPNLLMAKEPEACITTHPQVVRAAIKILKEIGCQIFVGDAPSVFGGHLENIDKVFEKTGIKGVCEEEGVNLVKFEKRRWRGKFPLTSWLDECDYLVSLPKFKTHDLTILTGAIKNLFGLVPGTFKTELHKNYFKTDDFSRVLVDIYQEVMPALTIVDAIEAMEGDGPATSGRLRRTNFLAASSDCVALDSLLAKIMGLAPLDILTTKIAAKRMLGVSDLKSIQLLGERLEELCAEPFLLPATSLNKKIPAPVVNILKKFIKYYPYVKEKNCTRCGICIEVCPSKVINMKKGRIVFNYSGCISCFCCQESCPYAAIGVKKSLLAKIAGL